MSDSNVRSPLMTTTTTRTRTRTAATTRTPSPRNQAADSALEQECTLAWSPWQSGNNKPWPESDYGLYMPTVYDPSLRPSMMNEPNPVQMVDPQMSMLETCRQSWTGPLPDETRSNMSGLTSPSDRSPQNNVYFDWDSAGVASNGTLPKTISTSLSETRQSQPLASGFTLPCQREGCTTADIEDCLNCPQCPCASQDVDATPESTLAKPSGLVNMFPPTAAAVQASPQSDPCLDPLEHATRPRSLLATATEEPFATSSLPDSQMPYMSASSSSKLKSDRKRAHSAVERKYRGNLNQKIETLRKSLGDAQVATMSDGPPEPDNNMLGGKIAAMGNKKADVLTNAIWYVQESEHNRNHMLREIAFLRERVASLEKMVKCEDCPILKQMADLRLGMRG